MRAIIIMFATYSRIPMPRVEWEEKSRRRAICAFGLVGVVIGVLLLGLLRAGGALGIPSAALSCLVIAVPVLVTGGIHLDGFIDTSDARASYADKEEKLRILKDPHVGAFGIIRLLLYLLLVFAGMEILITRQMSGRLRLAAVLIPVLSRIMPGMSIMTLVPGGFFVYAIVMAFVHYITTDKSKIKDGFGCDGCASADECSDGSACVKGEVA